MKLTEAEALARITTNDHGILATLHPDRGVDQVPVVYAVADGHVGVPIDRVKAKTSTRLRRQQNLEADPRASLLIEQWDREDWTQLWWVRAELAHEPDADDRTPALAARLAESFDQYRDQPFAGVLVLRIVGVTGWEASAT